MITEADTCRKYVLPKLIEAGWDNDPHSFTEQKTLTLVPDLGARQRYFGIGMALPVMDFAISST
jgi:hypothetical protein